MVMEDVRKIRNERSRNNGRYRLHAKDRVLSDSPGIIVVLVYIESQQHKPENRNLSQSFLYFIKFYYQISKINRNSSFIPRSS